MKQKEIINRMLNKHIKVIEITIGDTTWTSRLSMCCMVCSHAWNASLHGAIYHGHGCPECAKTQKILRITKTRKSNEQIDLLVTTNNRQLVRVGEYVSMHTKIKWKCLVCAHVWNKSPGDIIYSNHSCPRCSKHERLTNDIIDERLKDTNRNIIRVGPSAGCMKKLEWQCTTCLGKWLARPNDILSTRKSGCPYCKRKPYSKLSAEWIGWVEEQTGNIIQHAGKGYEFKIPGTRLYADGYCVITNTIYEFHGNKFHGNPRLFSSDKLCHPYDTNVTAGQLYASTLKREQKIKELGYTLIVMWEDEWRSLIQK